MITFENNNTMLAFKKILSFLISNFGPLIGFYLVNLFWGFQTAVIVSIGLALAEYVWLKLNKRKIDIFFYFSSGIIVIFGLLDLYIEAPFFFKLESSITNLFFAAFFGLSVFNEKSITQIFAENQNKTSADNSDDKRFFFACFTLFWAFYFLVKALVYLWLNFNVQFEDALFLRLILGKGSLWVMLGISILLPKQIWTLMEKARVFPSQRTR
ncbi:septation protein IspZ [Pseudobdellovibrio sp. HCB154]|uniref:septation protein IspZ n=1 Tax=Pseudobdellovibrio sp. HCB154 TaxID=3386277 RepID=UPI00391751B3